MPDAAAATAPRSDADEGSVVIEGTLLDDPKIGRPVPGVLIVTNDPRYILPVRVHGVEPPDAEDFTVGESIRLGIHSPSRTFPGGVAKGTKMRLRIHWRRFDGGPRRYYHVQRDRAGEADR